MQPRFLVSLLAAAALGAVVANLGRAVAEPEPAWDRDLSRQLIRIQDGQKEALEAALRVQEQQLRALQEIARSVERVSDKCSR